jgi:hypothetical protein
MEQIQTKIIKHKTHIHDCKLAEVKSRDFHKIAYNIFNVIPDNEKDKHLHEFNSMIISWHYQPHETWLGPSGIWHRLQTYLTIHFPDPDKYKTIADIFNHP